MAVFVPNLRMDAALLTAPKRALDTDLNKREG